MDETPGNGDELASEGPGDDWSSVNENENENETPLGQLPHYVVGSGGEQRAQSPIAAARTIGVGSLQICRVVHASRLELNRVMASGRSPRST
jgi:hypothetical protein